MLSKKTLAIAMALMLGVSFVPPKTEASSTAMLVFSDKTRFDAAKGAEVLSELMLEKLVNSGKISFKDNVLLNSASVQQLYGEDMEFYKLINSCRATGNYNPVFESYKFNPAYANSIDLAKEGDIVEPRLLKRIGEESGVRYVLQGTIERYGTDRDDSTVSGVANAIFGLSGLFGLMGAVSTDTKTLAVTCTVRLLDTTTGKVVYSRRAMAREKIADVKVLDANVGADEMNTKMFYNVMDKVADKLAGEILADVAAHKLPAELGK